MDAWSAPPIDHETSRIAVAPAEGWGARGLPSCQLCGHQTRAAQPLLAVEVDVDAALVWTQHAHLLPSQCVAGGALALGYQPCDVPCDVCGDRVEAEALAAGVRAAPDDGLTMHLKCACVVAGAALHSAEASTQREMPRPTSQVMAVVGFGDLQNDEKCLVAVALGGWHSGAGYFAPRSGADEQRPGQPVEQHQHQHHHQQQLQQQYDDDDEEDGGNASDESVELVSVSTQQERSQVAKQSQMIDLSQLVELPTLAADSEPSQVKLPTQAADEPPSQSQQFDSTPRQEDDMAGEPSATGKPAAAAAASASASFRSPPATMPRSPKRSRTEASDAPLAAKQQQPVVPEPLTFLVKVPKINIVGHFAEKATYSRGVRAPKAGDVLHARRDKNNAHDKWAIGVYRDAKEDPALSMVGYIPKVIAASLAPLMDSGDARIPMIRVQGKRPGASKIQAFMRLMVGDEETQMRLDCQVPWDA